MDKFFIGPVNVGLQKDLQPWMIPDEAYAKLNNAYVWRGRVRKRFGSTYMVNNQLDSRLRIALTGGAAVGITNGAGAATGTVPGAIFGIGQMFSIGTQLYTVNVTGTPAAMITTGAGSGTYNTTSGAYVFAGAPATTQIYFYPASPVMGITQYEIGAVNDHPSYAFDTQFAYIFAGGAWSRAGTAVWTGNDADFFWSTTWEGITPDIKIMFVTNFNDPIRWWDGTTWTNFTPQYLAAANTNIVLTARLVIPFKDRLLLFNTVEQITGPTIMSFPNRVRFSQNGSPLQGTGPYYKEAWLEQTQTGSQGAGFADASTEEAIISAEFIKDRLIVYFERSTWELAYTGNEVEPFVWQKINTELGSESEFSTVPFDKVILTIGNSGVHACSGANVERVDNKIPNDVFQIRNANEGVTRVAGIRDYYTEMVYWTLPAIDRPSRAPFPNRVLVYNYKNSSWGYNDDCITTFGYFEQQGDMTWANTDTTWQDFEGSWSSGITQSDFRQIIAGNQQGFVYRIIPDFNTNEHVMQITDIQTSGIGVNITLMNHTLVVGEYIHIQGCLGSTTLNNQIVQVSALVSDNVVFVNNITLVGVYTGAGTTSRVSNIQILTKQWNFYNENDTNVSIPKVDFNVTRTTGGAITVDYYPSSTELSMISEAFDTNALLGTSVLETSAYALIPLESMQDRLWHPVYFQTQGQTIQLFLYFTDAQMTDQTVVFSAFELNGLVVYALPSGRMQ